MSLITAEADKESVELLNGRAVVTLKVVAEGMTGKLGC